MATTRLRTAADLAQLEPDECRTELVRGELQRMAPAGGEHGEITLELGALVRNHAVPRGLGTTFAAETGFLLSRDPDTVLAPDVAFVRAERLPPREQRRGFVPVVPDLVIEVISPSDRPDYVLSKVAIYRAAGVPLIWVFDPRRRRVGVYRLAGLDRELTENDVLDGEDVLPGFRLSLKDIFH